MIIFFQIANGPKKILEFAIKIVVICWAITRHIMEYLDLGLLRISLNSNGLGSKKFFEWKFRLSCCKTDIAMMHLLCKIFFRIDACIHLCFQKVKIWKKGFRITYKIGPNHLLLWWLISVNNTETVSRCFNGILPPRI